MSTNKTQFDLVSAETFVAEHFHYPGIDISSFDDRLAIYKLLIGLGSLGFFARSRQADKYKFAQDVIARIAR